MKRQLFRAFIMTALLVFLLSGCHGPHTPYFSDRGAGDPSAFTALADYYILTPQGEIATASPSYVNIMFQVTNSSDMAVSSLGTVNFGVQEDGEEVSPTESAMRIRKRDEIPYSLYTVIMLDNSASVGTSLNDIKEGAKELIKLSDNSNGTYGDGSTGNQYFLIYSFSDSYTKLISEFSNNVSELNSAIDSIDQGYNSTNLYGSIQEGLSNWTDNYSLCRISQGFLVLLTDGSDTQGTSTLSEALTARGEKKIITVGVGDEIEPSVLEQLGNGGNYAISDYDDLADKFQEIQRGITEYANSFYWLDYLSPRRGNSSHDLTLYIKDNTNDSPNGKIETSFNSGDFYSVRPGIIVNDSQINPDGIESISLNAGGEYSLDLHVYLSSSGDVPQNPDYLISSSCGGQVVNINENPTDTSNYILTSAGEVGETCVISIEDLNNGFTKTLTFEIWGS